MKFGIIGTGTVGQALAGKINSLSHNVMIGTRNVEETLSRTNKDFFGNPPFKEWYENNKDIKLGTFEQAAEFGDVLILATQGVVALDLLKSINPNFLKNKILIDVTNPLDFSKGMPPSLIPELSNNNSLGEEIQKLLPDTKVVKTFNTMWNGLMINPQMLGNGNHINFIAGNDNGAKIQVRDFLLQFGWKEEKLIDLGDISASRGTEAILLIWLRLMGLKQTVAFNFDIVG